MTMVDEATKQETGTATVEVSVSDLYRVLYNASLFVSKDDLRPILTCVHVKIADASATEPNRITAEATDSYVLGEDSCGTAVGVDVVGTVNRSYLILASDLAPILKCLKSAIAKYPKSCTITLTGSDLGTDHTNAPATITFAIDGATFSVASYVGDFPNTAQIIDAAILADEHQLPGGVISMNPKRLEVFGKVLKSSGKPCSKDNHDAAVWHFNGDNKAVFVTLAEHGSSFRALVMPIKPR